MNARARMPEMDFDQSPFLVIWETTRACDLACLHCRAEAIPGRDRGELTTGEAFGLMDRVRQFGKPLFVLTGGDPMKRPDVLDVVRYGVDIGLRMGMTPSGTPLMTPEVVADLNQAGLARLAMSLDGSSRELHDRFRGVEGTYDKTVDILAAARSLGLSTQVNTSVGPHNLDDLPRMVRLLEELEIDLWSVFFIVPTGRARPGEMASAEEFEAVFHTMYDLSKTVSFDIKSTAAPQYRRVVIQRQVEERREGKREGTPDPITSGPGFHLGNGMARARGVNDGNGFVFVDHRGEIFPSGFLPKSAGNVRSDDLADVYRYHPLFRHLRDPEALKGKCGACEFKKVCGGSRARAYAMTGDPLEADPFCAYQPVRWRRLPTVTNGGNRPFPDDAA